ncbi:hypothetical protein [Gloeobacter violaceus]|uniref:Gll2948 protein n=1 Tax=Gloeobacter violaceus (strain ATCC 29082 / PCC 7421) TaxID=251221 RepID=Q7NCN0_GLOVI|nr:hypothetical protein [Gloeobacter violaceus]BAC90889.1 gll2948 [Gloeobacter violaceus PCC 7421]
MSDTTLPEFVNYSLPVDRLLQLGDANGTAIDWPDYLAMGLTAEHIPQLMQLATNVPLHTSEEEVPQVWGPVHAWRTLGQLGAEAAVEPLLDLMGQLPEDDWVCIEIPRVLQMIGMAALPATLAMVSNRDLSTDMRGSPLSALTLIARKYPEARETVVAELTSQLETAATNDAEWNAFLIGSLIELDGLEALAAIESAFATGNVDEIFIGDWDDVQVAFGLKSPSRLPGGWLPPAFGFSGRAGDSHKARKRGTDQRRKMAKRSRKQNRKRR